MARLNSAPEPETPFAGEQFAAIAELRWRLFVNSLRTLQGRLELASRVFTGIAYSFFGIGGTVGFGVAAWYIVSHDALGWLALPLWGIFLSWQLFPVLATALSENFDAANFLRFPLNYRSYFLLRLIYGSLNPTTFIAFLWLAGLAMGIGAASPRALPWTLFVLAAFAAFNISLSRAVFSWIERWLARRKSREILGVLFFLLVISVQFVSPLMAYYSDHYSRQHPPPALALATRLVGVQNFLPPGLVAAALVQPFEGEFLLALGAFALLCLYTIAFLAVLHVRLLAQYRGENLSESPRPSATRKGGHTVQRSWDLGVFSGSVAAVFEKEFHYLSRSGPMLFPLAMPLVILLILRFSFANARHGSDLLQRHVEFAFPIGVAYALVILSNLSYNCLGTEGAGVQFYYMSPVLFRDVLLAKNLAHSLILALETVLVWIVVAFLFWPPSPGMTLATLVGAVFGSLVNFTVGNLMSLYSPKKIDWAALGRQRASGITALAVLGVQVATFGLAAIAGAVAAYLHQIWPATLILLILAAAALRGYAYALGRFNSFAVSRRESLIAEICRAS
jgi:ABC-2 type transport system permease protein